MGSFTIKADSVGNTVVSNRFIDEYMSEANDAELKVYLYLLRMMSAGLPTGVSDIADKFNYTERDILRSLKYWEKRHLLALELNENKVLTGVRFIAPEKEEVQAPRTMAPIVPIKLVQEEAPSAPAVPAVTGHGNYSRDQLKNFKENPETGQILFIAESYMQKNLSMSDIETLYFIHNDLGFNPELTDYLLDYCISKGSKNFAYIEKVAIDWAESGITTAKEAKKHVENVFDKKIYTIMKALGRSGVPTQTEVATISKWYGEYGFSMDIITAACEKTVLATDSHRLEYCEKILSNWKNNGVKQINDISALDTKHKKSKSETPSSGSFTTYARKDLDFDELDKKLRCN